MTVTVFGFALVDVSFLLFVILFLVCDCWWLVIVCCIACFIVYVNVGSVLIIPDNRWLKCALAWTTGRRTIVGKPRNNWDSQNNMSCRWKCFGDWSTMLTGVWLTQSVSQACTPYGAKPCLRGMLIRNPKTL